MQIVDWIKTHWVEIGVIFLALHTFLKAVRRAIDSTPDTDDNWFEKFVTFLGKVTGYFAGKDS